VLFDLIRVLLAALVVAVAPGWFWAGLLRASGDYAERITYSVALSMALVPAVALVPTRVLGMGVTLTVAVGCALVVFLAGLGAYLGFGAAKEDGEPVFAVPVPAIGAPALALLVPAFCLAIGVIIGVIPGVPVVPPVTGAVDPGPRLMITIALLVVAAGIVHLFASGRKTEPPSAFDADVPESSSLLGPTSRRLLLPAVLVLALVRGYAGPVSHDWPFIRGVDQYSHAVMADRMMSVGKIEPYLIYPPGFHTMTAEISRLSGLDPLRVFPVLGPALLLLPALALYALGKRLWGWEYGVAAAFLSVLLGGTYYYFNDAMYPNLVTSQFLMVLAIASLVGVYSAPSARNGLLLALLGSAVVLYHPVASMYLAILLALVVAYFVVPLLFRDRRLEVALLLSLALLGSLCVVYAWSTYDLGGMLAGLVGHAGASTTDNAVKMAVGTQTPYPVDFLIGTMVSQPVAWLGLFGIFLLVEEGRRRMGLPAAMAHITVFLWALMLFVGSRTALTGFPQRFGRDLGVPLALLGALALVTISRSPPRGGRAAAVFVSCLAVLLSVTLVGVQAAQGLYRASGPSVQMTITPRIAAAGKWLEEHNNGGNIVVSPQFNQVPSRMMLAMGHYSALQSFTPYQITHPRDLPPTGPKPLWDVLWVVTHPDSRRTDRILRALDVRYVVLYKREPDRPVRDYWLSFESHPGLYRTDFENKDVLIVERRWSSG
jgi:hypothetical protein